jgi:hypothetical protein
VQGFAKKIVIDRLTLRDRLFATENRDNPEHRRASVVWRNRQDTMAMFEPAPSPLQYRYFLTYFDQIDIPVIPPPQFYFIEPEWEYLRDVGFLTHTIVGNPETYDREGVDTAEDYLSAPTKALEKHAQEEPGIWSFFTDFRQSLTDRELVDSGSLEVNLMNCLPIPSPANALPDIIEYRRRYRDELLKLRTSLNTLYQRVLSDPDIPASLASVGCEISGAVEDVTNSMTGVGIGRCRFQCERNSTSEH